MQLYSTRQCIEVSVLVVRTFVKLRGLRVTHQELRYKLIEVERKKHSMGFIS